MAKKYERFIKTYSSEKILQTSEIWVDKETGVNYIKKLSSKFENVLKNFKH